MRFLPYIGHHLRFVLYTCAIALIASLPPFILYGWNGWALSLGLVLLIHALGVTYLYLEYRRYQRNLTHIEAAISSNLNTFTLTDPPYALRQTVRLLEHQAERDRAHSRHLQNALQFWEKDIEALVHDVKSPLAACRLIADDPELSDPSALRSNLYFLERRVTQILYYAKTRDLTQDFRIRSMSLSKVVGVALANMAPYLVLHHVRVEQQNLDHTIQSDPKWLEFILQNLIENSIKYTDHSSPYLTFAADTPELGPGQRAVDLYVIDDGPGFNEAEMNHVLRRGFTGKIHERHQDATGLGLYLVKTMCDQLAIDVTLIPPHLLNLDRGAVIRLRFFDETFVDPALRATQPDHATQPGHANNPTTSSPRQ